MTAWLEIAIVVPLTSAELVHGILDTMGCPSTAQTFLPDGKVRLVGYLPATEGTNEWLIWLAEQLDYAVAHGWLPANPEVTTKLLEADEWEEPLRQALQPIAIGERFLITLNDEPVENHSGRWVLRLQSLGGFGTGHHPTTRLCLEFLERLSVQGKRVLDVGTGSGILAIAAAFLGAREVVATDIDDAALEAAAANIQRNGVTHCIRLLKSDLLRQVSGQFDLVLSNLLTPLIKDLAWQLRSKSALVPDGVWIGSGVSNESWDEVRSLLAKLGYRLLDERTLSGWVAFQATVPR